MKRTTITLSNDLAEALTREARRRSVSASAVARQALAEHLGLAGGVRRELPFAAVGRSGLRTTARDMAELLAREWGDDARRRCSPGG
jgi:predicted transcriptional regulator